MTDLSETVAPKSDQLTADDLVGGPITVQISKVVGCAGEQPIAVHFEGDNGRPFKPCKTMRRVLLHAWGRDGNTYTGRAITLFRDPKVTFGGLETGGIRISHMSHIDGPLSISVQEKKGRKAPYRVQPLKAKGAPQTESKPQDAPPDATPAKPTAAEFLDKLQAELNLAIGHGRDAVDLLVSSERVQTALDKLRNGALARLNDMVADANARTADDDFPGDR